MSSSEEEDYHSADESGPLKDDQRVPSEGSHGDRLAAESESKESETDTHKDRGTGSDPAPLNKPTQLHGSESGDHSSPGNETVPGDDDTVQYVSGLDNRYVSEDVVVKDAGEVELTEEQIKELREQANQLKKEGNDNFKSGGQLAFSSNGVGQSDSLEYPKAVEYYSDALKVYPPSCEHEIAVCHANRAACYVKMEEHEKVIEDCTKALELEADYLKAVMRRAQSHEALEKYEEAMEDYKRVLELDPSQSVARQAVMYLPEKIKEQQEKMKAEMMGKLKELGDAVLKPFGLSTSNFQFQQDPNTGGYSVNFKR